MSNKAKKQIRISASRIKSLNHCSYAFYLNEVKKLPEKTHWKTLCGTAVHNIFEYIMSPKRQSIFADIILNGFSFKKYPEVARYVEMFTSKNNVTLHTMEEFEGMIQLAFKGIKKYFIEEVDGKTVFKEDVEFTNEERFQIRVGDATISGFIDLLIRIPNGEWVVIDLKTQGKRFTKKELYDNVQALMYQLAVWKMYGKKCRVEFIMVRHPPTARTPDKHIQAVAAYDETQFAGFESYTSWLFEIVQDFSEENAKKNFCQDYGFCNYVCQFARPFDYQILVDKKTKEVLGSYTMDENVEMTEDQVIQIKRFGGCPKFNRD